MSEREMVKVAVLSSSLFVASQIHVTFGGASVHLILNGLSGLLLGWSIYPALAVALLLQAILFSHGGISTLGVNTLVTGTPGIVCYYLFRGPVQRHDGNKLYAIGFAAGALGIILGALLQATALLSAGRSFVGVAEAALLAHVPIMIAEGFICGSAVGFLKRVRPEALVHRPAHARSGMTRRSVCTALLFALIAPASFGHGLTMFASIEDGAITGRVTYTDDEAGENLIVTAKGPSGEVLGEAKTDEHGRFRLVPTTAVTHILVADDGAGHRAEFSVDVTPDDLTQTPQNTATVVDGNLSREVRLMREELDAFKRHAQIRDIIGGIGYIVGVAGLLALLKTRRVPGNGDVAR
jgi:cobalt/nickel transport system permease protein